MYSVPSAGLGEIVVVVTAIVDVVVVDCASVPLHPATASAAATATATAARPPGRRAPPDRVVHQRITSR